MKIYAQKAGEPLWMYRLRQWRTAVANRTTLLGMLDYWERNRSGVQILSCYLSEHGTGDYAHPFWEWRREVAMGSVISGYVPWLNQKRRDDGEVCKTGESCREG